MVHRKQKIMFWIKFSLLQTSPHHGFVLNLLHDLIFWRRRRRRTWRTSSRPKRLRWRRRMILMMVEATKSYIWFGGPYKALNHPKSSSRNPCGPNCLLFLFLLFLGGSIRRAISCRNEGGFLILPFTQVRRKFQMTREF